MKHFSAPRITCSWCGEAVQPNSARMRIFKSESIRVSGIWLAHLHVKCGDDLLDFLEARTTAKFQRTAP